MPPTEEPGHSKSMQEVVDELGLYPADAFRFVQEGLAYAVKKFHGARLEKAAETGEEEIGASHHISGQQLCEGLREYALTRWGLMARTVLRRWGITGTLDFGRIVFAMVDNGLMQKTEDDTIEDFRNVFDFKTGFEGDYRIEIKSS